MDNTRLIRLWASQTMPGLYFAETHEMCGLHYGRPIDTKSGTVMPEHAIESMYSLNPYISFVEVERVPEVVSRLLEQAGINDRPPGRGLLLRFLQHLLRRA